MTLKLKRILISILCILFCVCGTVALKLNATNSTFKASADVIEIDIPEIQDFYKLSSRATFPSSVETKVNPDDADSPMITATNGLLYYPDGKAYPVFENKVFALNLQGTYKLRYFAEYQNEQIIVETEFLATDNLYGLSSENSSFIDYATDEYLQDQMTNNGYEPASYDAHNINDTKLTHSGNQALSVNLEEGTQFIYSRPVDLRNIDDNGLSNIISFEPRAEDWDYVNSKWVAQGAVARYLVIKLTDCYDPTRYIELIVSTPQSTSAAALTATPYVRARTDSFQQDYGLWSVASSEEHIAKYPTTGSTNVSGVPNKVLTYPEGRRVAWTTQNENVWHYGGSVGGFSHSKTDKAWINLKYDNETSTVYASTTDITGVESTPTPFTDFFNEVLYPVSSDSIYSTGGFRPFTTGEVYVSISYEKYKESSTARVDVFSIGDTTFADLFDQEGFDPELGAEQHKYVDNIAPLINVDFTPTLNGGAFVAIGEKFVVPSAQAYDIALTGDCKVSAWQNYGTDYQLFVPIVDGKITISSADTYHIVYEAQDKAGNVAKKVIKVFGSNKSNNTILLEQNVDQFANIKAGAINTFVAPSSIESLNIGEDYNQQTKEQLKLKIEITSSFENIVLADLVGLDAIQDFLSSETKYRLNYAGKYQIKYYLADNAYNNYDNPISYEFDVVASDIKAIYDEPFMYRHYIKGAKYDFDKITAYEFSTGKPVKANDAELWIKYDGGSYVKQDSVYGVQISGNQTLQAKYVYGGAEVETGVYPIVTTRVEGTRDVLLADYFVGNFTVPELKPDGKPLNDLLFVSNTATGNNTLQYILPLNISNFGITYRINDDSADFGGIKITLTDIYNADNKLSIYSYKSGVKYYVQYNQESPRELGASFVGGDVDVSFALNVQTITVSGLTGFITANTNFTSTSAYLDIELCDITGNAGVTIKKLSSFGSNLQKKYRDRNAPTFAGTLPTGTYKVGDTITVTPAIFADDTCIILKNNTTLSVKLGNSYIRADDGTLLDGTQDPSIAYNITFNNTNALGKYTVQYTAVDNYGNSISPMANFTVKDDVAPEITFSGSIKEDVIVYAKPGYKVNLKFTMTDNVTPTESLTFKVFIFNTHTASMYAVSEKSFKLNYIGTYEISVACYDADDNVAIKTFTVVISYEGAK
ncbi:MAG: DUF5011 domain-containing protein [Clostridiales bacterium]|nr:DUF5011 domain-containing protein [Clostridiales bacterium]